MKYLKQSTSTVIPFGPALLPADGVTLVTSLVSALDHATTGIFLCKNGGAAAIRHATVTATTYDAYGSYLVTLDTTDTGTLGRLRVMFAAAANTLPIWEDFTILSANIFDSLVGGTDLFDVSVTQLLGTAWLTPGVAGTPDVNAKQVGGQTASASGTVTFPNATLASTTNITAGTLTTATNLTNAPTAGDFTATMKTSLNSATPAVTVSDKTGFSLSTAGILAIWHQLTSAIVTASTIGKLIIDNLDATISSRTKPADTQAAVTLVATTTNLTNAPGAGDFTATMKTSLNAATPSVTVSDKTGFALTAGEHTNVVSDVNTALDAATAELTSVPGTTASLRTIIQFIGQYFRFKRNTTATTETMYKADSTTNLGTSTVSDDGTTAIHGKIS